MPNQRWSWVREQMKNSEPGWRVSICSADSKGAARVAGGEACAGLADPDRSHLAGEQVVRLGAHIRRGRGALPGRLSRLLAAGGKPQQQG